VTQGFRFQFLLEQAQERGEKSARLMGGAKSSWQAGEQKLQQLTRFVDDYRQRLFASQQAGLSVNQWRDYQLFMLKLDTAVKQQQADVNLLLQRFEEAKAAWMETQKQVKALQALAERHEKARQAVALKREQKELDEYASKMTFRRFQEEPDQ
jgi:flagellar FliJ protein